MFFIGVYQISHFPGQKRKRVLAVGSIFGSTDENRYQPKKPATTFLSVLGIPGWFWCVIGTFSVFLTHFSGFSDDPPPFLTPFGTKIIKTKKNKKTRLKQKKTRFFCFF